MQNLYERRTNKMSNVVYLSNEFDRIKTDQDVMLNLQNRICKIYIKSKQEWIYFKVASETAKTLSGYRLQRDQYDNNKFYVTDEKNKWYGIITDGSFTKGRWMDIYD